MGAALVTMADSAKAHLLRRRAAVVNVPLQSITL